MPHQMEQMTIATRSNYLSQAMPSLSRSFDLFALYNLALTLGLYLVLPPLFFTFEDLATPPGNTLFRALQFEYFLALCKGLAVEVEIAPNCRTANDKVMAVNLDALIDQRIHRNSPTLISSNTSNVPTLFGAAIALNHPRCNKCSDR
jgi:hypothetical protein